jgi:DNA adenine methylase
MSFITPLRYPGGKQKLTPFILELLTENDGIGGHYVEPYAGGAGVALELLLANKVSHIHLNDSSFPLYAFWRTVLYNSDRLCRLISSASLTVDEWKKRREIVKHPVGYDELEVGYSTFFLNRCNHSGVLSGGLIGGLSQTGEWKMDARFPRNELIRRIELITSMRDSITLTNLDAEEFITEHIPHFPIRTFVYCDPPYFKKSKNLYMNHYKDEDHRRIAEVIQERLPRKWVVSYDDADEILSYYSGRRMFVYDLQYNAARVYKGKEVFVFSDDLNIPFRSTLSYINQAIQLAQFENMNNG